MANFTSNIDLDKIIPQGLQDENMAFDMIKAGQVILKNAIQTGANKHRKTGSMASSVKSGKPYTNSGGDAVGKVYISGKDKDGMSNAQKALWIEYGTKNMSAKPFVRTAVKSSEGSISSVMKTVFEKKVGS